MPLPNKRKGNISVDLQMGPLKSRSTDYSEAHIPVDDVPAEAQAALDKQPEPVLHDRSTQMYDSPHNHLVGDESQ